MKMPDTVDRIYAIGDVHGMYDMMMVMLGKIEEHADGKPYAVVFLGDLVDRGPKSRQVVAKVKELVACPTESRVVFCIAGNHEQLMVLALDEHKQAQSVWLGNGGHQTLVSYADVPEFILQDHLEFLRNLPVTFETPGQIFVHGGLDPIRDMHDQSVDTMLWIRGWWDAERDFGKHVVYGHSVQYGHPIRRKFSTGLDTGACHGGGLTAAWFDPNTVSGPKGFLTVSNA